MNDTVNTTAETTTAAPVAPVKPVLTKDQKIANINAQIAKLQQRLSDVINDVVRAPAAKVIALPEVGAVVEFTYGRTTPTTTARELIGTVVAVKAASEVDGKKLPALVRVSVGEGFDAELLTIYPSVIKPASAGNDEPEVTADDIV